MQICGDRTTCSDTEFKRLISNESSIDDIIVQEVIDLTNEENEENTIDLQDWVLECIIEKVQKPEVDGGKDNDIKWQKAKMCIVGSDDDVDNEAVKAKQNEQKRRKFNEDINAGSSSSPSSFNKKNKKNKKRMMMADDSDNDLFNFDRDKNPEKYNGAVETSTDKKLTKEEKKRLEEKRKLEKIEHKKYWEEYARKEKEKVIEQAKKERRNFVKK